MRSEMFARFYRAVAQVPGIVAEPGKAGEHEGTPEDYLIELGMTKADLKRFERLGLAVRGYKPRPKKGFKRGRRGGTHAGYEVRWIITLQEEQPSG